VVRSGADGIAVVSALCSAPDPEATARNLSLLIKETRDKNL